MLQHAESVHWRFDNFLLDRQQEALFRLHESGAMTPVAIGSRALRILQLLLERHGELASNREIMQAVWPNVAVEQNNLTVQITALRRLLDANGGQGSSIRNVPGRGYRFAGRVSVEPGADDPQRAEPADRPVMGPSAAAWWTRRGGTRRAIVVAFCLCLALVPVLLRNGNRTAPTTVETSAASVNNGPRTAAPAMRPRLSLVVLPFAKIGGDGLTDALMDAITDDLTTELARTPLLVVAARSSALVHQAKPADVRRIGLELGVRYAVDGSVRRVDDVVRINVQLVSTETNEHLWAGHFDAARDEISDVVLHISAALRVRLIDIESERSLRDRPNDPDLTDLLIRGQHSLQNLPENPVSGAEAIGLYERALSLDPASVEALSGLAQALLDSIGPAQDRPDTPGLLRRAEELIRRGELLRPEEKQLMFARVLLLGRQRRCAELIPAAQRAIEVHPSLTGTHFWLGRCMILEGRPAEAIAHIERSIRVNPNNPQIFGRYRFMAEALLNLGRYDDAISWFHKALASNPNANPQFRGQTHAAIAAAQSLAGRLDEARLSAAEATRVWPMLTVRGFYPSPISNRAHAAQAARVLDGLRLAGIRDHADEGADYGLPPDDVLHTDYQAPTPVSVPGARTILTSDLALLLQRRHPLILETKGSGKSVPGAIGLSGAGIGGGMADEIQRRLQQKLEHLTRGDRTVPIVTVGYNAERFEGRNLALRLAALGYSEIYWYRGGREAWEVASLPTAEIVGQGW